MIMPGVQIPHWSPCSCRNPSWSGCSSLAEARPSTGVTSRPSTCTASIVQDLMARPRASTVQAPPGLDLGDLPGAVEGELDLEDRYLVDCVAGVIEHHRHDQAALSVAWAWAAAVVPPRMRVTKTRTSWRLYSAEPRWSVRGCAARAARSAASAMLASVSGPPVSTAAASVAPMVD